VLTVPGDLGDQKLPKGSQPARFAPAARPVGAALDAIEEVARVVDAAPRVTMLVGCGAREARREVLDLADRLRAPMVLTLKAKEGLEHDNDFQVGQSGLLGNPAAAKAMDDCDLLLMVGTDFPYRDWYPEGKTVVQVDLAPSHIGRRTTVHHALVGDAGATLRELAAAGAQLVLSTGSSPERARRVLHEEGWQDGFTVVLGSDAHCPKGRGHYARLAAHAPDPAWTRSAVTVGDSPADMRFGAEHGVPVRIGVDRDGDPAPLIAAGATHVVRALAEVVSIVKSVAVAA
jgi:thiamine pyrophosphate-dependent acetolactate synthase large subunit-like protein